MEAEPVVRSLTIALLVVAPALAQTNCPPDCPPTSLVPVSGRVLNAIDSSPISGAIVRYRALGEAQGVGRSSSSPHSGFVVTGRDGRYALPQLPEGDITVRVTATGFLGDQRTVREQPARRKRSSSSVKPPVCVTTAEGSSCAQPSEPNDDFTLYHDPLELRAMPNASLIVFNLPRNDNPARRFLAAAFSPDGENLAFLTLDSVSPPGRATVPSPPFKRCVAWTYALGPERLTGMQGLELSVCEGTDARIAWDTDGYYIAYRADGGNEQAVRVRSGDAEQRSYDSLPVAVKSALAATGHETAAQKQGLDPQMTSDGQFSIQWRPYQGCGPLMVTFRKLSREQAVTMGCEDLSFLLDREHDLLFYNESLLTDNGGYNFGKVTEAYLETGRRRSFRVPVLKHAPQLLAWRPLGAGSVRMAYAMDGDCDGTSSDYTQPGQPDSGLGETPNQSSVCFITIPPLPDESRSASTR